MLTKIFCFQHSEGWGHRRNVYQAVYQIAPTLSVLAIPAYICAALLHMFIYVLLYNYKAAANTSSQRAEQNCCLRSLNASLTKSLWSARRRLDDKKHATYI